MSLFLQLLKGRLGTRGAGLFLDGCLHDSLDGLIAAARNSSPTVVVVIAATRNSSPTIVVVAILSAVAIVSVVVAIVSAVAIATTTETIAVV